MKLSWAMSNITARAALVALGYVLATAGLLTVLVVQLRSEALDAARKELAAFAQLTADHTFEVARGVEQALRLAELTLTLASSTGSVDEDNIGAMLRDVARNARVLKEILVLDADGKVVYQADGRKLLGTNLGAQLHFPRFREGVTETFEIAPAVRGLAATSKEWLLPMAHVWRREDGQFAGVIVGLMDPGYFDGVWSFDNEIGGLAIALASDSGITIVRRPFIEGMIGKSLFGQRIKELLKREITSDVLELRSPVDDLEQLYALRRVGGYPNLVVLVSQPTAIVLADWQRIAIIIASCWVLASLALGVLGAWLAREMAARGVLENRYRALFDSIPHSVIVSDEEFSRALDFNDAAGRQYALRGDAANGDCRLPRDFGLLAERRSQISADVASHFEGQRQRNGAGQLIDVDITVRPIEYDGRPAMIVILVDVTDRAQAERARRSAEDQLRQAQKMEAVGQLTGGLAHDFNNILMVIQGNVESLLESEGKDSRTSEQLAEIAEATQRAEDLTRQLLAFSRKQPLRPRPTDVNDLIVETGKLLRRALGEQVEIDAILAEDLWRANVDRAQLETSLVNLCLNARDAMPRGGRVLIETHNVQRNLGDAPAEEDVPIGDAVLIEVTDSGTGIEPSHVARIFEPFFTTKAGGVHSGLGLSMVYGFVQQSKGQLEVTSNVGQGTTFRLYFPRCLESSAVAPADDAALAGGTERVLVVEDDEQVRASVVRQLNSLGYTVEQAPDAVAALAAIEAAATPFDVMLTDIIMPGPLNGKELAEEVIRREPQTKVLFMSGYTDNALNVGEDLLLSKPFRKRDLARMIRFALDSEMSVSTAQ
jgi:PAS domain S-box-containing protein